MPRTTQSSIYTNNNDKTTATTKMPRFNNCNNKDAKGRCLYILWFSMMTRFNNCKNNDAKV